MYEMDTDAVVILCDKKYTREHRAYIAQIAHPNLANLTASAYRGRDLTVALYNISTKQKFNEKVLQNPKVVLVDFWASWCAPCVAMTPHLEAIGKDLDSVADIVKINIEDKAGNIEAMMLAGEYGVQSIPNMPIFRDGKEVDRFVGMVPKAELARVLIDIAQARES